MNEKQERILELNRAAQVFFRDSLKGSDAGKADAALRRLGIKPETAERFGLGYAPDSETEMLEMLASEGWSKELIEEAGLRWPFGGSGSSASAVFQNVVTFPYSDAEGNILGFAAPFQDDEGPDWFVAPFWPVFDPAGTFFGLDLAVQSGKNDFILVGDPLDAVLLSQEGFAETIAPYLLSWVKQEQAELLKEYAKRITVIAGPGASGKKDAKESAENLKKAGLDVRILELPGQDAVDYIRTHGAAAFARLATWN